MIGQIVPCCCGASPFLLTRKERPPRSRRCSYRHFSANGDPIDDHHLLSDISGLEDDADKRKIYVSVDGLVVHYNTSNLYSWNNIADLYIAKRAHRCGDNMVLSKDAGTQLNQNTFLNAYPQTTEIVPSEWPVDQVFPPFSSAPDKFPMMGSDPILSYHKPIWLHWFDSSHEFLGGYIPWTHIDTVVDPQNIVVSNLYLNAAIPGAGSQNIIVYYYNLYVSGTFSQSVVWMESRGITDEEPTWHWKNETKTIEDPHDGTTDVRLWNGNGDVRKPIAKVGDHIYFAGCESGIDNTNLFVMKIRASDGVCVEAIKPPGDGIRPFNYYLGHWVISPDGAYIWQFFAGPSINTNVMYCLRTSDRHVMWMREFKTDPWPSFPQTGGVGLTIAANSMEYYDGALTFIGRVGVSMWFVRMDDALSGADVSLTPLAVNTSVFEGKVDCQNGNILYVGGGTTGGPIYSFDANRDLVAECHHQQSASTNGGFTECQYGPDGSIWGVGGYYTVDKTIPANQQFFTWPEHIPGVAATFIGL